MFLIRYNILILLVKSTLVFILLFNIGITYTLAENNNNSSKKVINQINYSILNNNFFREEFFNIRNLSYAQWIDKAKLLEQSKNQSKINKAIKIYAFLINSDSIEKQLIARLRLAHIYLKSRKLTNNYKKAIEQITILEKTENPSYLIFTYYLNSMLHARGYGYPQNKKKALFYQKKYQDLFQTNINTNSNTSNNSNTTNIRVSPFLGDISITSPKRLKELILSKKKSSNRKPAFWKDKVNCNRQKFSLECFNPAWSLKSCQQIFYNDKLKENLCEKLRCNERSKRCFDVTLVKENSNYPLYQRASENSPVVGAIKGNAKFLMVDGFKYNKDQASWVEIKWCEEGPITFLNQCFGDVQIGYIKSSYLKASDKNLAIEWLN